MANMNISSFPEFLDIINRDYFKKSNNPVDASMIKSSMVTTQNIPMNTGSTKRRKERPVTTLYAQNRIDGGVIQSDTPQIGYDKDTESRGIALAITISFDTRMMGKNKDIIDDLTRLSGVLINRRDLDLSMHLSYAFSTSYTDLGGATVDISTGDGLALASASHTLTGSTTTYSTVVADNPSPSKTTFQLMRETLRTNTYNNKGEQVTCNPNVIWSTNDATTTDTIKEYLKSRGDVEGAHEGIVNVYQGRYRHEIIHKADYNATGSTDSTKAKYFGMVDTNLFTIYEDIYVQPFMRTPSAGNNGEDVKTLDWVYLTGMNRDSCVPCARGFVISKGDGS